LLRSCLLKHVTVEKIRRKRRRGRRRKLLNNLKEYNRYWNLKDKALDSSLWRTGFGRGYGRVVKGYVIIIIIIIIIIIKYGWSAY
jgi:hypothetical protein